MFFIDSGFLNVELAKGDNFKCRSCFSKIALNLKNLSVSRIYSTMPTGRDNYLEYTIFTTCSILWCKLLFTHASKPLELKSPSISEHTHELNDTHSQTLVQIQYSCVCVRVCVDTNSVVEEFEKNYHNESLN